MRNALLYGTFILFFFLYHGCLMLICSPFAVIVAVVATITTTVAAAAVDSRDPVVVFNGDGSFDFFIASLHIKTHTFITTLHFW